MRGSTSTTPASRRSSSGAGVRCSCCGRPPSRARPPCGPPRGCGTWAHPDSATRRPRSTWPTRRPATSPPSSRSPGRCSHVVRRPSGCSSRHAAASACTVGSGSSPCWPTSPKAPVPSSSTATCTASSVPTASGTPGGRSSTGSERARSMGRRLPVRAGRGARRPALPRHHPATGPGLRPRPGHCRGGSEHDQAVLRAGVRPAVLDGSAGGEGSRPPRLAGPTGPMRAGVFLSRLERRVTVEDLTHPVHQVLH